MTASTLGWRGELSSRTNLVNLLFKRKSGTCEPEGTLKLDSALKNSYIAGYVPLLEFDYSFHPFRFERGQEGMPSASKELSLWPRSSLCLRASAA